MCATFGGLFGVAALALAALGLYSVLAYSVAQRTREIGVRMALGARRSDIIRLVVRQGLIVAAAGIALGLAVDAGLLRVTQHHLYGVALFDPLAVSASTIVVLGVALLASWLPARQATRVDPLVALRAE
jgi:ABC-type antimicrobial peptide transport system permease subunit